MLRSSAHVCRVSGNPTNVTKVVVRAIFAPVATFTTCWTYYCVTSRLCSRTCAWWCSRPRFWHLDLSFSRSWAFTICRCSGGSIGGSIAFWWILVISVLIVDWRSLWWSSSLWCMCRCCRGWSLWHTVCWAWRMTLSIPFFLVSMSIEDDILITAFLGHWLLLLLWQWKHVAYLWW